MWSSWFLEVESVVMEFVELVVPGRRRGIKMYSPMNIPARPFRMPATWPFASAVEALALVMCWSNSMSVPAPKFAFPGDGGALGESDVRLSPSFLGVIALKHSSRTPRNSN